MAVSTPAQRRSLWFATLVGPVTWSVYFLAGYSLAEAACRLPLLTGSVWGHSAVTVALLALTAATLLLTLYAAWLAYAHWRRLKGAQPAEKPPTTGGRPAGLEGDTDRFLAVSGILLNGLFALLTIANGLPPLLLPPCG
jgi:hypothetical protein